MDEDDVQLLIRVNKEKFLSAPLCLVTKPKVLIPSAQSRKESESSNHVVATFDPIGTIVPETVLHVVPETEPPYITIQPTRVVADHQDPSINLNNPPRVVDDSGCNNSGDDDSGECYKNEEQCLSDEMDPFFYDDLDGIMFDFKVDEDDVHGQTSVHDANIDVPSVVGNIGLNEDVSPPVPLGTTPNQSLVEKENDVGPSNPQKRIRKSRTSSTTTGARTVNTECNSISVDNDIHVDQVFQSKDDLTMRLQVISMLKNREYKTKKSDQHRFIAVCAGQNCKWRLRATKLGAGNVWAVKRYHKIHTCSINLMDHKHRNAKSKVLSNMIKYRYTNSTHVCPSKAVITEVKQVLGIDIGYDEAWRAREEALKSVRGTPDDSFRKLPSYLHSLREVNPGTNTHLEIDAEGHFKYCYVSLGASIRGFWSCIRPVLAVDGTHLKGKYRGVLLLAQGMDGNKQIYPIAYAIVDSENNASWNWFLRKLHDNFGHMKDLVIISDRNPAISKGVSEVFPNALHGICLFHLRQNVTAKFKNVDVSSLLYCAGKTYDEAEHISCMNTIMVVDRNVYNYLMEASVEQWARVYFPGRRYSIMTTNIAESMNSVLRDVREYPPVSLLDSILTLVSDWFAKRRESTSKVSGPLTAWAEKKISKLDELSRRYGVRTLHHFTYEVQDEKKNAVVDLNGKTCSCRRFQLDQMPCEHAIAVATKCGVSKYQMASPFYTSEYWLQAYAEPIMPVGHEDYWNTSEEIAERVV